MGKLIEFNHINNRCGLLFGLIYKKYNSCAATAVISLPCPNGVPEVLTRIIVAGGKVLLQEKSCDNDCYKYQPASKHSTSCFAYYHPLIEWIELSYAFGMSAPKADNFKESRQKIVLC